MVVAVVPCLARLVEPLTQLPGAFQPAVDSRNTASLLEAVQTADSEVEHSLELAFAGTAAVRLGTASADKFAEPVGDPSHIEAASAAEHTALMGCLRDLAGAVDTGIGIVICTFAFDWRGKGCSGRSADMGTERRDKLGVQSELTAFAGVDKVAVDCVEGQGVALQLAAVASRLNCRPETSSSHSSSRVVRQVPIHRPACCANKVRTNILQLGTKPPGTRLHLSLPFQP